MVGFNLRSYSQNYSGLHVPLAYDDVLQLLNPHDLPVQEDIESYLQETKLLSQESHHNMQQIKKYLKKPLHEVVSEYGPQLWTSIWVVIFLICTLIAFYFFYRWKKEKNPTPELIPTVYNRIEMKEMAQVPSTSTPQPTGSHPAPSAMDEEAMDRTTESLSRKTAQTTVSSLAN